VRRKPPGYSQPNDDRRIGESRGESRGFSLFSATETVYRRWLHLAAAIDVAARQERHIRQDESSETTMSVTIHCPHCGATGNAPDHILGQSVRCSKCKKQFVAGGEEESEESDEAPEQQPADDFDDMDDAPAPKRRGRVRTGGGGGGGGGGTWFVDFATFRMLIAPNVLVILYWVVVAVFVLFDLGGVALSFTQGAVGGIVAFVLTLIIFPLQCLIARIGFELMLIQFRIYDVLKEMKKPE
jgi:Domain of unknown function (DUF4282)